MNQKHSKINRLLNGESFITSEKGNSMTPRIKSGQKHKLEPCTWEDCQVDDVVYCKVKGRMMTHLVTGKNQDKGLCISNNKGYVNGWTKIVYGKVIEIF